jgi:hypothetical protein
MWEGDWNVALGDGASGAERAIKADHDRIRELEECLAGKTVCCPECQDPIEDHRALCRDCAIDAALERLKSVLTRPTKPLKVSGSK